jgi:hypothetical protein
MCASSRKKNDQVEKHRTYTVTAIVANELFGNAGDGTGLQCVIIEIT